MKPIEAIRSASVRSVPWLVVFTALWAVVEALGYLVSKRYHFVQIVGMRYAVHLIVLLAICMLTSRRVPLKTSHPGLQILRGVCMFVWPASFIVAISTMPGRDLWALFWVTPLLIAVFAHWVLEERFRPLGWVLLACAHVGALLMLSPDRQVLGVTAAFALIAALAFAVYITLSRSLRDEPLATSLFYTGLTVLICSAPFVALSWQPIETRDLAAITGIGAFGLLALYCVDRALQLAPASFVAPFLYGAVAWEVALQVLGTHELPSSRTVLGAAIVFVVAAWWLLSQAPWRIGRE
jgi:drug/metabolite transporter (DMT)-like permease